MHVEQRFKVKQIYEYARDHLRSWFPLLPSYEAFNMRLNRMEEAFKFISKVTISHTMDCTLKTFFSE
jgi:hypothetical protein